MATPPSSYSGVKLPLIDLSAIHVQTDMFGQATREDSESTHSITKLEESNPIPKIVEQRIGSKAISFRSAEEHYQEKKRANSIVHAKGDLYPRNTSTLPSSGIMTQSKKPVLAKTDPESPKKTLDRPPLGRRHSAENNRHKLHQTIEKTNDIKKTIEPAPVEISKESKLQLEGLCKDIENAQPGDYKTGKIGRQIDMQLIALEEEKKEVAKFSTKLANEIDDIISKANSNNTYKLYSERLALTGNNFLISEISTEKIATNIVVVYEDINKLTKVEKDMRALSKKNKKKEKKEPKIASDKSDEMKKLLISKEIQIEAMLQRALIEFKDITDHITDNQAPEILLIKKISEEIQILLSMPATDDADVKGFRDLITRFISGAKKILLPQSLAISNASDNIPLDSASDAQSTNEAESLPLIVVGDKPSDKTIAAPLTNKKRSPRYILPKSAITSTKAIQFMFDYFERGVLKLQNKQLRKSQFNFQELLKLREILISSTQENHPPKKLDSLESILALIDRAKSNVYANLLIQEILDDPKIESMASLPSNSHLLIMMASIKEYLKQYWNGIPVSNPNQLSVKESSQSPRTLSPRTLEQRSSSYSQRSSSKSLDQRSSSYSKSSSVTDDSTMESKSSDEDHKSLSQTDESKPKKRWAQTFRRRGSSRSMSVRSRSPAPDTPTVVKESPRFFDVNKHFMTMLSAFNYEDSQKDLLNVYRNYLQCDSDTQYPSEQLFKLLNESFIKATPFQRVEILKIAILFLEDNALNLKNCPSAHTLDIVKGLAYTSRLDKPKKLKQKTDTDKKSPETSPRSGQDKEKPIVFLVNALPLIQTEWQAMKAQIHLLLTQPAIAIIPIFKPYVQKIESLLKDYNPNTINTPTQGLLEGKEELSKFFAPIHTQTFAIKENARLVAKALRKICLSHFLRVHAEDWHNSKTFEQGALKDLAIYSDSLTHCLLERMFIDKNPKSTIKYFEFYVELLSELVNEEKTSAFCPVDFTSGEAIASACTKALDWIPFDFTIQEDGKTKNLKIPVDVMNKFNELYSSVLDTKQVKIKMNSLNHSFYIPSIRVLCSDLAKHWWELKDKDGKLDPKFMRPFGSYMSRIIAQQIKLGSQNFKDDSLGDGESPRKSEDSGGKIPSKFYCKPNDIIVDFEREFCSLRNNTDYWTYPGEFDAEKLYEQIEAAIPIIFPKKKDKGPEKIASEEKTKEIADESNKSNN